MTTNHFEQLDPALVRPGRVDVRELLDDAVPEQAERLFKRFYGKDEVAALEEGSVDRWARQMAQVVEEEMKQGKRVSMAALQGHFIRNGPGESLERVRELFAKR
jgi:chaperone BCS1